MITTTTITEIEPDDWQAELDRLTWQHEGDYVTIEVVGASLGDQVEVDRLPFAYVTYDHKADTALIVVGGTTARLPVALRHLITRPVKVVIDQEADSLLITDSDDTTTVVRFYRGE
ncbi:DUF5335 family protein [Kribbella sp.]|uniref:DUF5335 family protein n=1 Tax=Kribbella sp. TaxID=1871183 RepID=UPI002D530392|nr:DUF5335 family protein [Kribbella sp.]HZX02829.1 DUF5335 family protein [Kribbella sp.]